MASTKRTRTDKPSRRFETIILKDLQSLHKWSEGLPDQTISGAQNYSFDCDRLMCNETLEDLEDVWARPAQPKWANRAQFKRASSQKTASHKMLKDAENVWATPVRRKCARKAPSKLTNSQLTLPQPMTPVSPAARSVVPPNSPANLSPARQSTSNPYITYLIQSWEAGSPVLVNTSSTEVTACGACGHDTTNPVLSLQGDDMDLMLVRPDDILVIPDSSREVSTSSPPTAHTPEREEVFDFSTPTAHNTEVDETFPSSISTAYATEREEAFPFTAPTVHTTEGEVAVQCVPQRDQVEHSLSQSWVLDEDCLFVEEGFITAQPSSQSSCQQDHVVPHVKLEE